MVAPTIVGAGLAGLIAAHAWTSAKVFEAGPPAANHRALLRFRSDTVSRLTGIPFRKVRVRKGIWHAGEYRAPDIRLANMYSQKCLGRLESDRSIWNLDAADRFIAPETLYEQMVAAVGDRVSWNTPVDFKLAAASGLQLVSTAPLGVTLAAVGVEHPAPFSRAAITVERFHIHGTDLFQTVYFPSDKISVYRASITGSTLIVEHAGAGAEVGQNGFGCVMDAFGISAARGISPLGAVKQSYGKIAPIDDVLRKGLLLKLTRDHGIFSLGRFATWRNILLDDVVQDIDVLKRLMRGDGYELFKGMTE